MSGSSSDSGSRQNQSGSSHGNRAHQDQSASGSRQKMSGGLDAFDLLPEAVVVVAADGTVEHANDRAAALLRLGPEAVGRSLEDVVDLRDDAGAVVTDRLHPSGDRAVADRLAERVLRLVVGGQWVRPVAVGARLLDDGRTVLTFRHAGRREQIDAVRSDLIATVSHEIRSPLTSVKGFTQTMLDKWERFTDDQKRQMLATINVDSDRVTRLLTELLDAARIDAGRVRLERQIVDVGPIVARVAAKADSLDSATRISVDIPDGVPHVFVDPDKVEQVVTNLVENAVRHAPGSDVRVRLVDGDGEIEVAVSDNGPGIPEEELPDVFSKFGLGRKARRSGAGLGLYITKGLVEAHGGRVWVESEVGVGTTFHVALPKGGTDPAPAGPRNGRG
jgi:signal transduction histidine kinase